jgi:O-methyltransferase
MLGTLGFPMRKDDFDQLIDDVKVALSENRHSSFGIIGHTPVTYDIIEFFRSVGADHRLLGVYSTDADERELTSKHWPINRLQLDGPDVVIIASDRDKEHLLELAAIYLRPQVRVLLAGYGHLAFRDPVFDDVMKGMLVPSLANGYQHTLVHLYQCLQNAARLGLNGVVAEFGMFKGGTTMLLSRFVEGLGQSWRVIGFDTFAGFPAKRSVLDMYDHPDCIFSDEELVRRYLSGRDIEVVAGDVVTTADRLANESIVLVFMDTDNYSSASAILDVVEDRVVIGGAIVFDHFTGHNRFRYTLGERMAGKRLLADSRYFNLHDTGVFIRQR